jgi:hypothetical protein
MDLDNKDIPMSFFRPIAVFSIRVSTSFTGSLIVSWHSPRAGIRNGFKIPGQSTGKLSPCVAVSMAAQSGPQRQMRRLGIAVSSLAYRREIGGCFHPFLPPLP